MSHDGGCAAWIGVMGYELGAALGGQGARRRASFVSPGDIGIG